MTISTITTKQADDIMDAAVHLAIQTVSEHRWYVRKLVVFEQEEGLMGFYYLDPATELQEDGDRYEGDPVPIFPVEAREKVTTVYEAP